MRLAWLVLCVPLYLSAANPVSDPEVLGAQRLFEVWLNAYLTDRELPGAAVGVVHDQELIWAKGFGYANLERKTPITAATKFRMASHSKLFTATAIMQLREAGKLRLDDPVSKHLPWFQVKPAAEGDPPITVEELLTHASGLAREAGPHWTEFRFPDAAGVRKYVDEHAAVYPPETRWKYSNLAYTVAGMVVEAVSGERFADYVQRRIFTPLEMKDSSIDREVEGLATGYGRRMPQSARRTLPFIDSQGMAAATGVTSTLADMAKFVSLQFRKSKPGGAQILSAGALRQMHRVRMLENNWTRGTAIGFQVTRERDRLWVGHGGAYPGYTTHTLMQLDDRVGVIVLTNAVDSNPADIARQLMDTVGAAVAKAASPTSSPVSWDPSWSRYAGLYRSDFRDAAVVELDKRLVLIDPSGPNPTQQTRLIPLGGGRFRMEAPAGGTPVGEIARFEEENGRVVRLHLGDSYSTRVR